MSLKKISRYIFHSNTIKIVSLIFIVGFLFILPTYADGTATTGDVTEKIMKALNTFISLCSRGWVILAILAGKLMTNDFVYGAFLHMDVYLWKIWNIMKNFANFALIALVIGSIVKNLVGKEAIDVKKIITNTLLAGILIQASWFLVGAVVDISTVATAGISAFPIAFLKNDAGMQDNIKDSIDIFKAKRMVINLNTGSNQITSIDETNPQQSSEELRQNILPNENSVSGPFIYLGMGVFSFQNMLGTETTTDATALTLGFALRFFLLFFFTVGLFLLLIANIMRIGLLWVFIIGSPFLILIQIFKPQTGEGSGILKLFSISNFLAIVFKPVIFVIGISLMLIVIVSMQSSITGSGANRENNLNGVKLGMSGASTSTLTVEGISSISIDQTDILGKNVIDKKELLGKTQNFFSYILMLLLTLFLMRRFIKLSLTTGGGPIEKTMEHLTGLAEDFAKSAPILGGKVSFTSAKSFMEKSKQKTFEGFGFNKDGEFGSLDENGKNFKTNEDKFSTFINDKMDLQAPWTQNDWIALGKLARDTPADFFGKSQALAKDREGGLSVNNPAWMNSVKSALNTKQKIDKINAGLAPGKTFDSNKTLALDADEKALADYFNGQNVKALYHAMGGQAAAPGKADPTTYDALKQIVFYATGSK